MSKQEKVVDFYTDILNDLSLSVVGDGYVSFINKDGDTRPVTIGGHRLVLPTRQILKEAEWDERILFHPLSEQASTELSPIMNSLKNYVTADIQKRITLMVTTLISVAADTKGHKRLGVKAKEFLALTKDIDDKSVKSITTIVNKIGNKPEDKLVNVLLRNGKNNEGVLRMTAITFPFVEYLERCVSDNENPFSSVRKKDLKSFSELFRYVAGETIKEGSNDKTAPYFESLLLAFQQFTVRYNELLEQFSKAPSVKALGEVGAGEYTTGWAVELSDFKKFAQTHHAVAPSTDGTRPELPKVTVRDNVYENDAIEVSKTKDIPWDTEVDKETPRVAASTKDEEQTKRGMSLAELKDRKRELSSHRFSRFSDKPRIELPREEDTPRDDRFSGGRFSSTNQKVRRTIDDYNKGGRGSSQGGGYFSQRYGNQNSGGYFSGNDRNYERATSRPWQ